MSSGPGGVRSPSGQLPDAGRADTPEHPLRKLRAVVDGLLAAVDEELDPRYAKTGWDSIPLERLLRASLIQILHSIRSERPLVELIGVSDLLRSITVYDKCILRVLWSGSPRKSRQNRGGNRPTTRFLFLENVSMPGNRIISLGVSSYLALLAGLALADLYFSAVGLIVTSDASWGAMGSKLIPIQVLTALEIAAPTVLFRPAWLGIRKLIQARAERLLCLGMIVAGFLFGVLVIQQRMLHLGL